MSIQYFPYQRLQRSDDGSHLQPEHVDVNKLINNCVASYRSYLQL